MSVLRKNYFYSSIIIFLYMILFFSRSILPLHDPIEQVRAFTRDIEFDYISWTFNALEVKINQLALNTDNYLTEERRHDLVIEYIYLVYQIQTHEALLEEIYSDPSIENPDVTSADEKALLSELYRQRELLGPLAESIIQDQLSNVIEEIGLSLAGQPVPPILYRTSPLPLALIVSPRDVIRQDADISLEADLTLQDSMELETSVEFAHNVSALVVEVGGIGVYPTMVMQTSDLTWLVEVVAHEWIHNYLTMRPLGLNYETSPELRTMNETTASIAGKEIGKRLIAQYYPELLPPEVEETQPDPIQPIEPIEPEEPVFNFQREMHLTRVIVDKLLETGKVEQAESFMETRRQYLWDNGYHIRKINQAYFAFHGAYADEPVGAAGEDPVGAAVRALRAASPTLKDFINQMSWMYSYETLQQAVTQ